MKTRPRAWAPGEGHRFDPGSNRCMHCQRTQETSEIRQTCWTGLLYDFGEGQGRLRFDRARMFEDVGVFSSEDDVLG